MDKRKIENEERIIGIGKKRKMAPSLTVDTKLANIQYDLDTVVDDCESAIDKFIISKTFMGLLFTMGELPGSLVAEKRLTEHVCNNSGCWCSSILLPIAELSLKNMAIRKGLDGEYVMCVPRRIRYRDTEIFVYINRNKGDQKYSINFCAWMESYKFLKRKLTSKFD